MTFEGMSTSRMRWWRIAYYLLFIAFLGTAALNMFHVRGGFLTNHAADLVVPSWLYITFRGLQSPRGRETLIQRTIGRTPGITALSLFSASTVTEVSQLYWPHGIFSGRFDPLDVLAYACGLVACYVADKLSRGAHTVSPRVDRRPAA